MINIRLEEEGAFVEIKQGKVSHWKQVTIPDIVAALNKSIGKKVNTGPDPSPVLPPGTIGYTKYPGDNSHYELLMYQQEQKCTIIYEDRVFEKVCAPAAVYRFIVHNKNLIGTHIWAITENIIRPEVPLFHYPFYNINNGRLCMGANHLVINEPWELFKAPAAISAMPSTRAYPFRNTAGLEGDSLFKQLQKKKVFPSEWLSPANITLGQIMKAGK